MKISHLSCGYKDSLVFKDISLEIIPGSWVFLVGKSGCGKTTLLQTLAGNLPPLSGSVVDTTGKDIYRLSTSDMRKYRRSCGMIFQDFKLIQYKTVAENIAFALEICGYPSEVISQKVTDLIKYVGLIQKQHALPSTLSGGEAQRVAIARALIHDPVMILADEPTGNLDVANTKSIFDILKQLHNQGKTIVCSTHDLSLVDSIPTAHVIDLNTWK